MSDPRLAWRLRGELAGASRSFPLVAGVNRIGSAESNEVALPVRGVSRHHARLVVEGHSLTLEDLGSRNGTRANGVTVQRALVRTGDRVGLGPLELVLEEVDPEDEELALVLDGAVAGDAPTSGTTSAFLAPSAPGLAAIEALLGRLADGWDASGAAEALRESLRARCVAFVEATGAEVVVAWLPD